MKNRRLCVGYVPLLNVKCTQDVGPTQLLELHRKVDDPERIGDADALLWDQHGGDITPVLAINNAWAVIEHLLEWSDDQPSRWFKLYNPIVPGGRPAIILFPDPERTLSRFNIVSNQGWRIDDTTIICRPLRYVAKKPIRMHGAVLAGQRFLGIVDSASLGTEDHPDPFFLGPFDVGNPLDIWDYVISC